MAEKQSTLERLRRDLAEDGRLHYSALTPLTAHDETLLRNLTSKYVHALQDNIASRFKDSLPILSAFKIFDPVAVPPKSDQSFSEYVDKEIKILAEYLYQLETGESKVQKTEELICEWRKFMYSILKLKSEMPADVIKPPKNKELTSQTPTDWLLHHMLSNQLTYSHFVPELLCLAEVCMSARQQRLAGAWGISSQTTENKAEKLSERWYVGITNAHYNQWARSKGVWKPGQESSEKVAWSESSIKSAKSIPASATSSNCPTVSNAAVQVDMLPTLALDVPEQANAMGDGIGVEDLEKEVNSVISALKLPDILDMDDSDYGSDFESDSDWTAAGVISFSKRSTKLELELSETVLKLSKYKLLLN